MIIACINIDPPLKYLSNSSGHCVIKCFVLVVAYKEKQNLPPKISLGMWIISQAENNQAMSYCLDMVQQVFFLIKHFLSLSRWIAILHYELPYHYLTSSFVFSWRWYWRSGSVILASYSGSLGTLPCVQVTKLFCLAFLLLISYANLILRTARIT